VPSKGALVSESKFKGQLAHGARSVCEEGERGDKPCLERQFPNGNPVGILDQRLQTPRRQADAGGDLSGAYRTAPFLDDLQSGLLEWLQAGLNRGRRRAGLTNAQDAEDIPGRIYHG